MDAILFGAFPYVALALFVVGTMRRFRQMRDTVTTGSSQLLEGKLQYWGSVPWHHGILGVLLLHLLVVLLPGTMAAVLGSPARLVAVEVTGFALGVTAAWGIAILALRRLSLRGGTTTPLDWLVVGLLIVQVATGLWTALTARWGYAWFVHTATPWLWSLARLSPRVELMSSLPTSVQVHALNAMLLLALVPYTRLAHALVAPVHYLWRLPQVVVWRRPPPARGTR